MRINEVDTANKDTAKLMALSQFLLGRATDTDAPKAISTKSFINLAQNMGISLTVDQLKNLVQQPPLNSVIANVEGDDETGKIIFKGDEAVTDTMTVDQARITVDQMAKRALK
jgi:hypothetical protein